MRWLSVTQVTGRLVRWPGFASRSGTLTWASSRRSLFLLNLETRNVTLSCAHPVRPSGVLPAERRWSFALSVRIAALLVVGRRSRDGTIPRSEPDGLPFLRVVFGNHEGVGKALAAAARHAPICSQ